MLRGAGILTWSCPLRPLMLPRERHFASLCKRADAGWEGARSVKRRLHEGIHGSKTQTLSASFCDYQQAPFQHLQSISHRQVSASAKTQPAFESLKCTVVEDLGQDLKALSICWDRLINTTRLQPWRRSLDICQLSLHNRTQCNLQSLYHRQYFVRPFSLSTHQQWILNRFQWRPQPSFHQTRAVHQAAPDMADAWRDCLSAQNENRCRQSLRPNLKLYEADEGRQGVNHSQGKSQAKWASILVSLCSVEGEPSFLFTLRSSTLKGNHKGDVSFAGGKRDPADRDVVATALREAREELGVNVGKERVWGILKPLRDRSGMMVAPVLANLGPLEELSFKPNPGEVEEIFTLSLSHLCNPQNRGYTHFRTGDKYGYTLPVFRNGRHRVWGLTAIALSQTLNLIVSS